MLKLCRDHVGLPCSRTAQIRTRRNRSAVCSVKQQALRGFGELVSPLLMPHKPI